MRICSDTRILRSTPPIRRKDKQKIESPIHVTDFHGFALDYQGVSHFISVNLTATQSATRLILEHFNAFYLEMWLLTL